MCLLCVEIQKQKMTPKELARAYREFKVPEGHHSEIEGEIAKNYDIYEVVSELNRLFQDEVNKEPRY